MCCVRTVESRISKLLNSKKLSLVNEKSCLTGSLYTIDYILNSKNLTIVKKFGDKNYFTIARFHCIFKSGGAIILRFCMPYKSLQFGNHCHCEMTMGRFRYKIKNRISLLGLNHWPTTFHISTLINWATIPKCEWGKSSIKMPKSEIFRMSNLIQI